MQLTSSPNVKSLTPFPYLCWPAFISESKCAQLITDVTKIDIAKHGTAVMGGRYLLPNTSSDFQHVLQNSPTWLSLNEHLNSDEFLQTLKSHLGITEKYQQSNIFSGQLTSRDKLMWRIRRATKTMGLLRAPTLHIFSILALRILFVLRRFRVGILNRLCGRVAVELLFDYSLGMQGYEREIHRDSDARDIVFLLYLNSTADSDGGMLRLHQLVSNVTPQPRPNPDDCTLLLDIAPVAGTLIAFRNTAEAYHSVQKIVGFDTRRHFIYGGYTRLVGRSKSLRLQTHLKTDWATYT